jgi:hypothetical protein
MFSAEQKKDILHYIGRTWHLTIPADWGGGGGGGGRGPETNFMF